MSAIAPAAGDSSGSGDVVSYPVTVTLTGAPSALRAGMTADITIVTDSATNVLTIPPRRCAARPATSGPGAPGRRHAGLKPVEVGLVTSTTAEITSGLTEGEAVVTGTPRPHGDERQRQQRFAAASAAARARSWSTAAPACSPSRDRGRDSGPGDGPATRPIISLRGVSRIYDMGQLTVPALRSVDLDVEHGEFLAIVGPSGSGKSTLMNIVGCLDRPTAGNYLLAGTPVEDLDDDGLAAMRSRTIGFVFQSYNLLPRTTRARERRDAAALPGRRPGASGRAGRPRRSSGWASATGVPPRADRAVRRPAAARGHRPRARHDPPLILADEPTGNLDRPRAGGPGAPPRAQRAGQHDRPHHPRRGGRRVGRPPGAHPRRAARRMSILELIRLALSRLRTSRLRAALTMLGVIIGVASVVALVGVGPGRPPPASPSACRAWARTC